MIRTFFASPAVVHTGTLISHLPVQDACPIRKGDFYRFLPSGDWRLALGPMGVRHGDLVDVRCVPENMPLLSRELGEQINQKLTAISSTAGHVQQLPKTKDRSEVVGKAIELLDLAHRTLKSIE